jgi:hypothetical protein
MSWQPISRFRASLHNNVVLSSSRSQLNFITTTCLSLKCIFFLFSPTSFTGQQYKETCFRLYHVIHCFLLYDFGRDICISNFNELNISDTSGIATSAATVKHNQNGRTSKYFLSLIIVLAFRCFGPDSMLAVARALANFLSESTTTTIHSAQFLG